MKAWFLGIAACAGSLGCVAQMNEGARANLLKRASYELSCPTDKLKVVPLEEQVNGRELTDAVEGCGKRATYVVNAATDRSWVRNGEIEALPEKPAPVAVVAGEYSFEPWMTDNTATETRGRKDLGCPSPDALKISRHDATSESPPRLVVAGCGREQEYQAKPVEAAAR